MKNGKNCETYVLHIFIPDKFPFQIWKNSMKVLKSQIAVAKIFDLRLILFIKNLKEILGES